MKYVAPRRYLSRQLPNRQPIASPNVADPNKWETIAEGIGKAGWVWGCTSRLDSKGKTTFLADAHRDNGKRLIVRADDRLTAFVELARQVRAESAPGSPTQALHSPTVSPEISERRRKPPTVGDIVSIAVPAAVVVFAMLFYAYSHHDIRPAASRAPSQLQPEIRKAIPVQGQAQPEIRKAIAVAQTQHIRELAEENTAALAAGKQTAEVVGAANVNAKRNCA